MEIRNKGTVVMIIPWQDIGVTEEIPVSPELKDAPLLPEKDRGFKVNVVDGPRGSIFRGKDLIPLLHLSEKDQKLSPEKAFQKKLPKIIAALTSQIRDLRNDLKACQQREALKEKKEKH